MKKVTSEKIFTTLGIILVSLTLLTLCLAVSYGVDVCNNNVFINLFRIVHSILMIITLVGYATSSIVILFLSFDMHNGKIGSIRNFKKKNTSSEIGEYLDNVSKLVNRETTNKRLIIASIELVCFVFLQWWTLAITICLGYILIFYLIRLLPQVVYFYKEVQKIADIEGDQNENQ